jgi:hypothetical protein
VIENGHLRVRDKNGKFHGTHYETTLI